MSALFPAQPTRDIAPLQAAAGPTGATTVHDLARRWPVAISVLSARLRGRGIAVRPDRNLEEIAAACGAPLDALLDELTEAAARDARGECVWDCRCR